MGTAPISPRATSARAEGPADAREMAPGDGPGTVHANLSTCAAAVTAPRVDDTAVGEGSNVPLVVGSLANYGELVALPAGELDEVPAEAPAG